MKDSSTDAIEPEEEEPSPALPYELLLHIMKVLFDSGKKRTLATMGAASRDCHSLALPLLLKELTVNSFTDPTLFLTNPDRAKHVRRLEILYMLPSLLPELLEAVLPYVEVLSFHASSVADTSVVWRAAEKSSSPSLKTIEADLMGDAVSFFNVTKTFPASVKRLVLFLDSFARSANLLQTLDQRATGLVEWELHSEYVADVKKYPELVKKLKFVSTSGFMNNLSKIVDLHASLRTVQVNYESIRTVDLAPLGRLNRVENLILRHFETAKLLDFPSHFSPDLKTLTVRFTKFTAGLTPAGLAALRNKVVAEWNSLKIVVEATEYRAEEREAQAEVAFWKSLGNVRVVVRRE